MIRCLKTTFYASHETMNRLFDCNRVSAEVWNHCLALAKEKHAKTGEWVTKSELQKATKGLYPIHSQSIQAVCHKYIHARESAHAARRIGFNNKYPYNSVFKKSQIRSKKIKEA